MLRQHKYCCTPQAVLRVHFLTLQQDLDIVKVDNGTRDSGRDALTV